jgi:hypothetical protein
MHDDDEDIDADDDQGRRTDRRPAHRSAVFASLGGFG